MCIFWLGESQHFPALFSFFSAMAVLYIMKSTEKPTAFCSSEHRRLVTCCSTFAAAIYTGGIFSMWMYRSSESSSRIKDSMKIRWCLRLILSCWCLKPAWISNIFLGCCLDYVQLCNVAVRVGFPPAENDHRSKELIVGAVPSAHIYLWACELKCIVSQPTLLMLQEAHGVLDVKFNNSVPNQIHALSLCEGASSQLRIRTI